MEEKRKLIDESLDLIKRKILFNQINQTGFWTDIDKDLLSLSDIANKWLSLDDELIKEIENIKKYLKIQ
ncbi:MAG: hypothetical protein ACI7YS_16190 [Flavobacterium sp.]